MFIMIVFVSAQISCGKKDKDGPKLVKTEKGTIVAKALAIGQIEPRKEISVKSKISGIVNKLYVQMGDTVKKGSPLLDISPNPDPFEFSEIHKTVDLAKIQLDNAKSEYERAKNLFEKGLVSQAEVDQKNEALLRTDLSYNVAKENLSLKTSGKSQRHGNSVDTIIKSPVDGTVLNIDVNEGDPIVPLTSYQAGTNLMSLANMNDLLFKGTVDEIDVGKLHEGMETKITIGALPGVIIMGTLDKIAPKAQKKDESTLFAVEIALIPSEQNKEIVLRAGFSANAELIIQKKDDVLVIPERLVIFKEGKNFVDVGPLNKEQKGEEKEIQLGLSDGLNVEIVSGLSEKDEVVEYPPKEFRRM